MVYQEVRVVTPGGVCRAFLTLRGQREGLEDTLVAGNQHPNGCPAAEAVNAELKKSGASQWGALQQARLTQAQTPHSCEAISSKAGAS